MGRFLYIFYIFLAGACVGSFVNAAALRSAAGTSICFGRSRCPQCGAMLHAKDLVPIGSFLLLRGKCRYCRGKIPARYPLTEAACGVLFVLCFLRFGPGLEAVNACFLTAILLAVFLIDRQTMTIPNGLILTLLALGGCELLRTGFSDWRGRAIGAIAVSVPLLLLTLLIPDCFGGGDIKLTAVCGFLLGFKAMLLAFFLALVSCGVVCAVRLARKTITRTDHIAFGPYLAGGIWVARLFYLPILSAYFSILLR